MDKNNQYCLEKRNLLVHVSKDQRDELSYRRHREVQVFSWSATVFIAMIGAFILVDPAKNILLSAGWGGHMLASIVALGLTYLSIRWQLNQRLCSAAHQRILARIADEFGCFDTEIMQSKETLYPDSWKNWGSANITLKEQLSRPTKMLATLLLGVSALISIWLSVLL